MNDARPQSQLDCSALGEKTPVPGERTPAQGEWTYEDYLRLPDDGLRYEVIRGRLYLLPAPRTKHQKAVISLGSALFTWVMSRSLGEVFISPTDVLLGKLASPVEPDVLYVRAERLSIIEEKYIAGAPDLVVEVLSPSNRSVDLEEKRSVYAEAGVREYWIVDVDARTIAVHVLEGAEYRLAASHGAADRAASHVLQGFAVAVAEVCRG